MSDGSFQHEDGDSETGARRGALDPILSNRDGLFSALEEAGRVRTVGGKGGEWSHRRGEPRLLVLCWAVYLLAASGATIMRLPSIGFAEPRFVQSAARLLVLLIAVGLTVLWPMVRLSQVSPRRPSVAAIIDLAALILPLAAVLWPVTWLGRWDWPVTAALLGMLGGWGVLLGALIVLGTRSSSAWLRLVAAAVCMGAVGMAPLVAVVLSGTGVDVWAVLYGSPLTGVFALTTEVSGRVPAMSGPEWWAVTGPLVVAAMLWVVVAGTRRGSPSSA